MKRKYVIPLVLVVLIVLVSYKLTSNKKKIEEKKAPAKAEAVRIPVKVATAQQQQLELNIVKTGNLTPFKEAKVIIPASGLLQQLNLGLGDYVKAGQIIGKIDSRQNQLELQKSESNVAKLKSDLDTYTELYEGKAATKEKVNEIRQNYLVAVNESKQLQRQIAEANIKAPTSGTISSKLLEEGVFVNAGTELATIINLSQAKVQVSLTETEVYKVKEGQTVKITTDVFPDKVFTGKVSFISPQADAGHNYPTEIMINNAEKSVLRSGTFVYVDFTRKTKEDVLLIPRESLTESVQNASVYVVNNQQQVTLTPVKIGREMNGKVEILEGIKAGDKVVTSGQINLKNGTPIRISN